MLFDIKLLKNTFCITIHKIYYRGLKENPFDSKSPIMKKYSYLGDFIVDDLEFGFDGCMKKEKEDENYLYFNFNFPQQTSEEKFFSKKTLIGVYKEDHRMMRKFLLSVYLCSQYVLEPMYYDKKFFDTDVWCDQTFSFVIFDGGEFGHAIGGKVYPWIQNEFAVMKKEDLRNLEKYIHDEMSRCCMYFSGEDLYCEQISITNKTLFIQCGPSGRWLEWNCNGLCDKPINFDSHNIDFSSDQELLFFGVIALNTYLQNKKATVSL